jgi:hypothetical protein
MSCVTTPPGSDAKAKWDEAFNIASELAVGVNGAMNSEGGGVDKAEIQVVVNVDADAAGNTDAPNTADGDEAASVAGSSRGSGGSSNSNMCGGGASLVAPAVVCPPPLPIADRPDYYRTGNAHTALMTEVKRRASASSIDEVREPFFGDVSRAFVNALTGYDGRTHVLLSSGSGHLPSHSRWWLPSLFVC